jgi:hypothetical protein
MSSLSIVDASSTPEAAPSDCFTFEHVPRTFALEGVHKESFLKWGLSTVSIASFRVASKRVSVDSLKREGKAFLTDILNSPVVGAHFHLFDGKGAPASLPAPGTITDVRVELLRCSATSLDLFDPFTRDIVVNPGGEGEEEEEGGSAGRGPLRGYIRRKMDEDVDGVTVSDLLKDTLLNPAAEWPLDDLLDPDSAQKELLFRLFKWIVTGGGSCQPEDTWGPYLEATKAVYRDMTSVVKDGATGDLTCTSVALAVEGMTGWTLFPRPSPHSIFLVSVDPAKALVTLLHAPFLPFW